VCRVRSLDSGPTLNPDITLQVAVEKYNETTGKTQAVVLIDLDASDLAPGLYPFLGR